MTTIKPVQSGSFEVSSTSSLNLSKIGKVTGTAPGKSMTPGPPTERRTAHHEKAAANTRMRRGRRIAHRSRVEVC